MSLVEGLGLAGIDPFSIQILGAPLVVVRVSRLLPLLGFERSALLLVEREGLLQPPKGTAFLLQSPRIARILRHRRHIAQHAHAHR